MSFPQSLEDVCLSATTCSALWGGATSLGTSVMVVLTKKLHGSVTMDLSHGIQKFHTTPIPRVGGLPIVIGLSVA